MPNPDLRKRIRTIFLHQRPNVSIEEASRLLGWSEIAMRQAITSGDIELRQTCSNEIALKEIVGKAVETWPMEWIERALGRDAALVLPPAVRTGRIVIDLPCYEVMMLGHLTRRRDTTSGHLIAQQLTYLAAEHQQELAAAIPGFGEACHWPYIDESKRNR